MRRNDVLIGMEDIIIIYQYLYMSENHFITVNNGVTKLDIRMNDNGYFHAKNLRFPDLPHLNYSEMMTIPNILAIIEQLKKASPTDSGNSFKNRWEEIKAITALNVCQNKIMMKK